RVLVYYEHASHQRKYDLSSSNSPVSNGLSFKDCWKIRSRISRKYEFTVFRFISEIDTVAVAVRSSQKQRNYPFLVFYLLIPATSGSGSLRPKAIRPSRLATGAAVCCLPVSSRRSLSNGKSLQGTV
ncbi:MAG: hypothetical protein LBQ54_13760, partial [Planctomycetaceae bacterium]|nr:hypothetical protein [Planctomycetaceae bacterium]